MLRDKISLCQAGIQYYVIYAAAHELYLRREYQRAMGMAEAALMMAGIISNCKYLLKSCPLHDLYEFKR